MQLIFEILHFWTNTLIKSQEKILKSSYYHSTAANAISGLSDVNPGFLASLGLSLYYI